MKQDLKYEGMIAPCGMNCGICIGHLREKGPCRGCFRMDDPNRPAQCRSCSIANCEYLARTDSGEWNGSVSCKRRDQMEMQSLRLRNKCA